MRVARERWVGVAVGSLALAAGGLPPAGAQETVVEGRVEVVEVGVLADLPGSLRGMSARDLASRVAIVEGGIERQPVSVAALGGEGHDPYGRVLVVVDVARCNPEILKVAPAALGAEAERLVALGPVEVALLGDELALRAGPSRSASEVAAALARVGSEAQCGPPPAPDRLEQMELAAASLACDARPCLLAWIGPGWGRLPEGEGAAMPPPSSELVEPLAKRLAGLGWTFLAAPIDRAEASSPKRHGPEPRYRPESGTYTFGINVLERRKQKAPMSEDDYSRFLDLWQAPLRRLVAATAGELAANGEEVRRALDALAARSILYYRSERKPSDGAPTLLVREPGEAGERFRTPEWAPVFDR
ncbi:MAG TPA: hypothetical protein VGC00_11945 [Thermoanaerobaculia bacterium]